MTRLVNWESRLNAYLLSVAGKPFRAGQHDCALFVAGAIEAMTGQPIGPAWRGGYRTIAGGVRRLRKAGHVDHIALAASLLPEVSPAFAHVGDVGVLEGTEGFGALGIVQGEGVYVLAPAGLGLQPRGKLLRAFRV